MAQNYRLSCTLPLTYINFCQQCMYLQYLHCVHAYAPVYIRRGELMIDVQTTAAICRSRVYRPRVVYVACVFCTT